jgi:hypothetical protein
MESVRKDIECTFGILKNRFRIWKTQINLHNKGDIDRLFKTSCVIHNMLLQDDGWATRHENPTFWSNATTGAFAPSEIQEDDAEMIGDDESEDEGTPVNQRDYSSRGGNQPDGPEVTLVAEREDTYFALRETLTADFKLRSDQNRVMWLK